VGPAHAGHTQAFGKIANFVVHSRLHFARNFIFSRKQSVPKFATSPSIGTQAVKKLI
jgi:riboflavin transporter FmnP